MRKNIFQCHITSTSCSILPHISSLPSTGTLMCRKKPNKKRIQPATGVCFGCERSPLVLVLIIAVLVIWHFRCRFARLQGRLLGGEALREEVHGPGVRRQNHQHQKAVGQRWVVHCLFSSGSPCGKQPTAFYARLAFTQERRGTWLTYQGRIDTAGPIPISSGQMMTNGDLR